MTFNIQYAERQSRLELLLRSFFGFLYILIPHGFLLFFFGLWGAILSFISWFIILFTGRYPQSFFEFQVGLARWQTRLNARVFNLTDGYPAFGMTHADPAVQVDIPYPPSLSRGLLLAKLFFGWLFVLIPHGFVLFFLAIGVMIASFIGWWMILFTGSLPRGFHNFIVGYMRWSQRVNNYMGNLTDEYPPFSLD
jgi:hypothetical protein